jgi:transposase InsO family protein
MARRKKTTTLSGNPKQNKEFHQYLKSIYYNPSQGASFSTPGKLLKEVRRRGRYQNVKLNDVKKFLKGENAYTLYRPVVEKFHKPKVRVAGVNEQFDVDLMDISRDSKHNSGTRYLLTAIDVFSKRAMAKPLQNKEGPTVAKAMKDLLEGEEVKAICTDRGQEFKSKDFQELLKSKGINHFFAGGSGKATVVESFHRTLRTRIARYQYAKKTQSYIHDLQKILDGYNRTYHRSIKRRPIEVTRENEGDVYDILYKKGKPRNTVPYQYQVGDQVRISFFKHPFTREFNQRWSDEIFMVAKRYRMDGINMYRIKDCTNEKLDQGFYAKELAPVTTPQDQIYTIDRVLDEKEEGGKQWVKVQWLHFPAACAEWIEKGTIQNV